MKASYRVEKYLARNGEWVCYFLLNNKPETGERGAGGTGCKLYGTREKAEAAGKRYVKKMQINGFEIAE